MRAFYDDFSPESQGREEQLALEGVHSTPTYISAGLHAPVNREQELYDDFLRIHQGQASIEPINHDFSYSDAIVASPQVNQKRDVQTFEADPFSMDFDRGTPVRQEYVKPLIEQRSEQFKQELTRRQYEHSMPYFDRDTQRLRAAEMSTGSTLV